MVGRTGLSRWLAVGLSTMMALTLAIATGGIAVAQDEAECPVAEVTGVMPNLTEQLGHKPKVGLVMKSLAN